MTRGQIRVMLDAINGEQRTKMRDNALSGYMASHAAIASAFGEKVDAFNDFLGELADGESAEPVVWNDRVWAHMGASKEQTQESDEGIIEEPVDLNDGGGE